MADALCDIQYVLSGAVLEFGLGERFKDLFEEVYWEEDAQACIENAKKILEVAQNRINNINH